MKELITEAKIKNLDDVIEFFKDAPQADDITMLAFKYLGSHSSPCK